MKSATANGIKGHLIHSMDGSYYFRVYGKDHTFVDYSVRHFDLTVTIDDEDAFLYSDGNEHTLDHSPATLGNLK